jgi:hypothetical protein
MKKLGNLVALPSIVAVVDGTAVLPEMKQETVVTHQWLRPGNSPTSTTWDSCHRAPTST